jgi:hypothetical protein
MWTEYAELRLMGIVNGEEDESVALANIVDVEQVTAVVSTDNANARPSRHDKGNSACINLESVDNIAKISHQTQQKQQKRKLKKKNKDGFKDESKKGQNEKRQVKVVKIRRIKRK